MATAGSRVIRANSFAVLHTPVFEHSATYRLTCCALLLWWIASFYPLFTLGDVSESLANASEATASGSIANRLLVISFAALGALYLRPAYELLRTRIRGRTVILLLAAYLLWAGTSVLWSIDRALTIRRAGEAVLICLGAAGLGAGFYSRTRDQCLTLARHLLYATVVSSVIFIGVAGSKGYFADLLNPDSSVKGETMVSYFVFPAAYGIISTLVLFSSSRTRRMLLVVFLGLILLLTKSRTALVGTIAVALLVFSRLSNKGVARTMTFVLAIGLLLVQVDLATGGHVIVSGVTTVAESFPSALPYLSLGNGIDDLLSLDGHVPLWQALWPMYKQHPWTGHGFGAFWNPARFDAVFAEVSWPAVLAHNGFLDELLATGVIGLSLFLAFWFYGILSSLQRAQSDRRTGYLVLGWLLLFLVSNTMGSIMQFYFQYPTLFSLIGLFSLLAGAPCYVLQRRQAAPTKTFELTEAR